MFYNIKLYELLEDGKGCEIIPLASLPIFPSEADKLPLAKDFVNYDTYIPKASAEYAQKNGYTNFVVVDEPYIKGYKNVYFYNDSSNIKRLSFSQLREEVEIQPEITHVLTANIIKNSFILPNKDQVAGINSIIQDELYDTIFNAEKINKILDLFNIKLTKKITEDYKYMLRFMVVER